jgi:hypothetical protein
MYPQNPGDTCLGGHKHCSTWVAIANMMLDSIWRTFDTVTTTRRIQIDNKTKVRLINQIRQDVQSFEAGNE